MYNKQVNLIVGKNKILFNYSYNDNTKFGDLLEYVSFLFPNLNLCQCFCFANNFNYINNDMKLNESNDINEALHLENANNDSKCHCSPEIKNILKMSKMEFINKLLNNNININSLGQTSFELNNAKKNNGNNRAFSPKKKGQLNNNLTNNQEIETWKKKAYDLEEKIKNQEIKNQELQKQLDKYQKINNLNDTINKFKKQIKYLEEKEKNLSNQFAENEKIINDLNKKIEDYEKKINGQKEQIPKLYKRKQNLERNLKISNTIHIDQNNNINESNFVDNLKDFNKQNFVDFYDAIIDIKSVKDINKGWKVKMNEKGLKNYKVYKESEIIKIGVIGNSNKGKSFILSKISKINFPSGTSIRTEGLSVKYPELETHKDRKIVLLDSAGLETPVLNNENMGDYNNEKEMFKEKSREKLITELFLQNYIINTSEILIVVVGILTYSEQKLLNRIRTEMQRAKLKKTLFVIHNLITYTSINQVKEYIEDYLLKSATFHLSQGHKINTSEQQETGDYYYEKNSEPKIFHLIYANEGSEAGKYYNNFTLKFIENSYLSVTDLNNFDIIESIKERFIEISKEIIEKSEQLQLSDFCKNDNDNYKLIKLNDEKEITLKKCLIDELGFSNLKARGFEPTYNFYRHLDGKTIIIRVEAPGNSEIKSKIEYRGENTIIQLRGKKNQDIEPKELKDNLFTSREFGDFFVDIPLKTEDFKILNEKPKIRVASGLFIIEYKLENKEEESEVFGTKQLV